MPAPNSITTTDNQTYEFNGKTVRIHIEETGKVWFCAKDVALALGYKDTNNAIKRHCKGVAKRHPLATSGGIQQFLFIGEGDVYRLIASSKLPSAERFESWLFDEVVPSIQDHGAYITPTAMQRLATDPDFIINLGYALKDANEKREQAERIAAQKQLQLEASEQRVAELAPKAEALDDFTNVDGSYSVKDAAALLSNRIGVMIGRNRLFNYMHGIGWIYRDPSTRTWVAYQAQIENGRLIMKAHAQHGTHSNGVTFPYPPTLRVTAKGLAELHKRLGGGNPPALPSTLGA